LHGLLAACRTGEQQAMFHVCIAVSLLVVPSIYSRHFSLLPSLLWSYSSSTSAVQARLLSDALALLRERSPQALELRAALTGASRFVTRDPQPTVVSGPLS
jgi:hypothetical protein